MSDESFEAPSLELLASLLPTYEFQAFIAQGGMGAVYQARQRSLDRDVAIKILPRELGADPEFRSSFETEAKAMARLNHPNLIGVYDFGDVDGMPYIVMEFVNGKSLFHSAYNMAVDPVQAVTIVKGICDGLAHAHENGVIHRDIKPANILLNEKVTPKIGDFGLARPAGTDSSGILMGTPGYAAPEITRHPDHADRRSDLFALGVVLYELLIGRCPPYDGYQPPPSTVCGCDPALDRICEKAMHPIADMRYPSAEAMSAALEAWLRRGPVASTMQPVTPAWRPAPVATGRRPAPPVTTRHASGGDSSGVVKGLIATAVVIVVGAIGWSKFKNSQDAEVAARAAANAPRETLLKSPEAPDVEELAAKPAKAVEKIRTEKPLDSLARLKADLAAGRRTELPQGSMALDDSDFMVIPTAMTWHAAAAFAESHGAHLVTIRTDKDLERLSALIPAGETGLWTGVGRAGNEKWISVDGTPCDLAVKPKGDGAFVMVDGGGVLHAAGPGDRHAFAIEWRRDGSNPATLAAKLQRTGESKAAGKPVFPAGTLAFEDHHFFIATAMTTYSEATEMARRAGGQLAVVPNAAMDEWLAGQLAPMAADDGFWIGATKEDDGWKWSNGEPWEFARWQDEVQADAEGGFVKMMPHQGWLNSYPGSPASGFIIEWHEASAVEVDQQLPPEILDLEAKAKTFIEGLEKDRQKDLAANVVLFQRDLDGWLRGKGKNERANWLRDVTLFKGLVKNNRVPAKVGPDLGIRLSPEMSEVAARAGRKQDAIDLVFQTKAGKIRDAYVVRLSAASKTADNKVKKSLDRRAKIASDLNGWVAQLSGEKPVAGDGVPSEIDPISGLWKWTNGTYIAVFPAGLVKSTGGPRGKWEMLSETDGERTYQLEWSDNGSTWKQSMVLAANSQKLNNQAGVSQAERVPETIDPEAPKASGKDPVAGAWRWHNRRITLADDGRCYEGIEKIGDWKRLADSAGQRVYAFVWFDGEYIDTLTLDPDQCMLEGRNNKGTEIRAVRVPLLK